MLLPSFAAPTLRKLISTLRRASALALLLPTLAVAQDRPPAAEDNPKRGGDAAVRAETDDATKRRDFQREWFETPVTPDFLKFLNNAAARERARNGKLLPSTSTDSTGATDASSAATTRPAATHLTTPTQAA
jgi:hypothetical protein